jgi:hypothetical protein
MRTTPTSTASLRVKRRPAPVMEAVTAWVDAWPMAELIKAGPGIVAGAVSLLAAAIGVRAGEGSPH